MIISDFRDYFLISTAASLTRYCKLFTVFNKCMGLPLADFEDILESDDLFFSISEKGNCNLQRKAEREKKKLVGEECRQVIKK